MRPVRRRVDVDGGRSRGIRRWWDTGRGQAAARRLRDGGMAANRPSGARVSRQRPSWTARWWARHSKARLGRSVRLPATQLVSWWPSHQASGWAPSGTIQPPGSRAAGAVRWVGVMTRVVRPRSRGGGGAAQDRGAAGPGIPPASPLIPAAGPGRHPGRGRDRRPPVRARGWGRGREGSWPPATVVVAAGTAQPPLVEADAVVGRVLAAGWRVVAGGVAADQDPGDGPVAGQPLPGLGRQRSRPAGLSTQPTGVVEAVQLHHHRQLRADPTGGG
jgi:hypothetical protein